MYLLFRQRAPEPVEAVLLALFGHVQYPASSQVVAQRQVVASLEEGPLVHSNPTHRLGLPPFQPALHRPLHDPMHLIPSQPQQLRHRALTRRLQPRDGWRLK